MGRTCLRHKEHDVLGPKEIRNKVGYQRNYRSLGLTIVKKRDGKK